MAGATARITILILGVAMYSCGSLSLITITARRPAARKAVLASRVWRRVMMRASKAEEIDNASQNILRAGRQTDSGLESEINNWQKSIGSKASVTHLSPR